MISTSMSPTHPRVRPIRASNRELEVLRMVAKGLGNKEITSALLESASGMRGVASRLGFGRCLRGFSSIAIPRSSLRSGELSFCSADDVAAHQSLWHRDGGVAVTIPC
jgi:Bacterial regulatory proteins, luxR family